LIGDVLLEIDEQVYKTDESFYGLDYGIESINLPYALLLLKLYGTDVILITLPPTESSYGELAPSRRRLLGFLDEIGCDIYVNADLSSRLILANGLALIGSVDLSRFDLCNPKEFGVIVDDRANLRMLRQYVHGVIGCSTPYGFTTRARRLLRAQDFVSKTTRGWLFEELVKQCFTDPQYFEYPKPDSGLFKEFVLEALNRKAVYDNEIIGKVAADLSGFYAMAMLKYLKPQQQKGVERRLHYLKDTFGYRGEYRVDKILSFLNSKIARVRPPEIPPRIREHKLARNDTRA
jgi:hypothetical protein